MLTLLYYLHPLCLLLAPLLWPAGAHCRAYYSSDYVLQAKPLRVYWYRDGLVRFATHKYDMSDISNQYAHLTNTSINKNSSSYAADKEGIRGGCKWSLRRFREAHPDHPLNQPLLWVRIRAIINLTLLSIAADVPDNGGCFELLGYDVIVDEALKPWLLEVNTSPALGVECDVDRQVLHPATPAAL